MRIFSHLGVEIDLLPEVPELVSVRGLRCARTLYVHPRLGTSARRWVLAHELGHVVLDEDRDAKIEMGVRGNSFAFFDRWRPADRRANRFAAELLMPADEFASGLTAPESVALCARCGERATGSRALFMTTRCPRIRALAARFQVSPSAAQLRYQSLVRSGRLRIDYPSKESL